MYIDTVNLNICFLRNSLLLYIFFKNLLIFHKSILPQIFLLKFENQRGMGYVLKLKNSRL